MRKSRSMVAALLALGLVLGGSSHAFTQDKPARPDRGEHHPQIHGDGARPGPAASTIPRSTGRCAR